MNLPFNPYNELKKKFPRLSPVGHDIFNRLLTYDPEKRIPATEAQAHDYFKRDPRPKAPILLQDVHVAVSLTPNGPDRPKDQTLRAALKRPRSG